MHFLGLGSDYENNYYEIELPLKITQPSLIDQNSTGLSRIIWPEENEINLSIEELLSLKSQRNRENTQILVYHFQNPLQMGNI